MPSSMELAARLSGVVSAQQEMLSVLNDPQQVMQLAVNRTPDVTNSAGAVVELAEGDHLVYRAASGPAARHIGLRIPIDDSISGSSIIEQRPIRCDDVEKPFFSIYSLPRVLRGLNSPRRRRRRDVR